MSLATELGNLLKTEDQYMRFFSVPYYFMDIRFIGVCILKLQLACSSCGKLLENTNSKISALSMHFSGILLVLKKNGLCSL